MGLMQKACETYEANSAAIGRVTQAQGTLCPVGHILQNAQIEITLHAQGGFIDAKEVQKEDSRTIIPATEKSASRTSGDEAHPLCDQLCYLCAEDQAKYDKYLAGLRLWAASADGDPDIDAVLTYVESKTILEDLISVGLLKPKDGSLTQCKIASTPYNKCLVRWIVDGRRTWQNQKLMEKYCNYVMKSANAPEDLCMISGERGALCMSHDKGVIAAHNGAKLVSSNDSTNFTYRGRFTDPMQACTISAIASQKAHRALQWVAATQGEVIGERAFLCWNPQGKRVVRPQNPFGKQDEPAPVQATPTAYSEALRRTLDGFRNELPQGAGVVIAVFDAATTGRLALTYYSEMTGNDFYDRVENWYRSCCWPFGRFGLEAPPLRQIAECSFGIERGSFIDVDSKVLRETMQRLLTCLLNGAHIPADIVQQLFRNASNPLHYRNTNNRIKVLCTACAVIRKYRNDQQNREEWTMELDERKNDRSYQFGRLLAVMEMVERFTYDPEETREPNAIRLQSMFIECPFHTAKVIENQLNPYFARTRPDLRSKYKERIGQILAMICQMPENEWNRPLEDTYLMGYYLQRNAFYSKKDQNNNHKEDNP